MIMLDTADLDQIEKYMAMGVIRGVTTNPTIMYNKGIKAKEIENHYRRILNILHPHAFPVSIELTTNIPEKIIPQAKEISGIRHNVVVKIPIHGPDGGTENLRAVKELEPEVRVNVTAMMSAQQGLLAAMAGASYVSLFGGRISNMGHNAIEEIRKLRRLVDALNYEDPALKRVPKIIVGSVREASNVTDWLLAGADYVTVPPDILYKMLIHPYTKETIKMFLEDAAKSEQI